MNDESRKTAVTFLKLNETKFRTRSPDGRSAGWDNCKARVPLSVKPFQGHYLMPTYLERFMILKAIMRKSCYKMKAHHSLQIRMTHRVVINFFKNEVVKLLYMWLYTSYIYQFRSAN